MYSVRHSHPALGRQRGYREHADLFAGAAWEMEDIAHWSGADELDPPAPGLDHRPQLYNIDAVGYESILLGFFMIHRGPPNEICEAGGFPKITELLVGYSRDGFHFDRRDRTPIVAGTHRPGDWNRDYIHSCGGCCLIVGEQLYLYFGAFSGVSPKLGTHMYAGGSTGLATLRRDGFVSHSAGAEGGILTTRPLRFARQPPVRQRRRRGRRAAGGGAGRLRQPHRAPLPRPLRAGDRRRHAAGGDLGQRRRPRRARRADGAAALPPARRGAVLVLGQLPTASGASHGYVAAGGPGFTGPTDTVGQ